MRRASYLTIVGRGAAVVVLFVWVGLAALAPVIVPDGPLTLGARPLLPPLSDPAHPLGTDQLGRDVAVGVIFAARTSLFVGVAAAVATVGLGAAIGLTAALAGRIVDAALMRLTDAMQALPPFLSALAIAGMFGGAPELIVVAIALTAWPSSARLVRAEALRVSNADFAAAARLQGLSQVRIACSIVLPLSLQPVVALLGVVVGEAILIESALAFLAIGDPNVLSWGLLVANGRSVVRIAPHLVLVPGMAIVSTVIAVSVVGDVLTRAGRTARC